MNLQLALRALRDANVPRTLWVDAVYINQEDVGEKNKQVAMMRKIYSNASRTIIYLREAFPFCRQLRSHMPTMELCSSVHGILGKINSIDFLEHRPICGFIAVFFRLCGSVWFKLFTRRWFTSVHLAMFMILHFLQYRAVWGILHNLLAILGQNILTAMVPPLLGGTRAYYFETLSNAMWKDSFVRRFGNGLSRL